MDFIMEQLSATATISPLVYILVLFGGVASALSPCFVPVLAMFGGYITGYVKTPARRPSQMAAAFTIGQALTLAGVGVIAVLVGKSILTTFTGYELDRYIPAAIGILMGLQLLGLLRVRFPLIGYLRAKRPENLLGAFTLGLPFGLVVTPCTIPVFIAIVTYLALNANVFHGALLMVAYAFGRGIILAVVAYSASAIKETIVQHVKAGRVSHNIERVSGAVILAASVYLLFFSDLTRLTMPGL